MPRSPLFERRLKKIQRFRPIRIIAIILLGIFSLAHTAFAQQDSPPWKHNLICEEDIQKYEGIEYCTQEFNGSTFHVIVIDLNANGVRIEYIIAEGEDRNGNHGECKDVNIPAWSTEGGCKDPVDGLYPVMTFNSAVERAKKVGAVVLINADYSACTVEHPTNCPPGKYRAHGPEGLTVIKNNRRDGPIVGDTDNNAVYRPWLAISKSAPLMAVLDQLDKDNKEKPFDWIYTGVGGGPWLIKSGSVQDDDIIECTGLNKHSCTSYVAQTAVGISQDRDYLYFVAAKGQNAKGIAEFMFQELNLEQAIKFDGGGSTQLWYQEAKKPFILRGDERPLTNYLAVIAEPGSGIVFPPDPFPHPGWLDRFLDWWHRTSIYQWWQGFSLWLENAIQAIKDLQELIENVQDPEWWYQQIEDLLLQCFGSLLLPVGIAISFRTRRKRKTAKGRYFPPR